ncbi:hypothetical protein L0Y49_00615, partial [bacterium]|nr:hypothetical protein [bacterium]
MSFLELLTGKKKDLKKKDEPQIASVFPGEIFETGAMELEDVIAPSAVKFSPREINLGEKIARTLFVMSYPRFLPDNWFSPVVNLDKVFDVSI